MKILSNVLALGIGSILMFGTSASAGECVAHVKRTACKGKKEDSYKKCAGKQECDVTPIDVSSEERCAKKIAAEHCPNSRIDITHSKVITAKFEGKAVKIEGLEDLCATKLYPKDQRDKEYSKCTAE